MEIAPFNIKKIRLDTSRLRVNIRPVDDDPSCDDIPAYLVVSTAPHNIDEEMSNPAVDAVSQAKVGLSVIAQNLHRIQTDPTITDPAELVIAVHGYNTEEKGIRAWYSDIYRHIAQDDKHIRHQRNLVFIGYRWSSERVSASPIHLWQNLKALPDVPQALLAMGLVFMFGYWGWSFLWEPLWRNQWTDLLGATLLSGAVAISVMILTLLLLRVTVYFRDVYRAINFAVPDLTELVRQIDQAVVDLRVEDLRWRRPSDGGSHSPNYAAAMRKATRVAQGEPPADMPTVSQKIKLNFLGHSMGGLVITNVVRILSDVFDRRSIAQNPVSAIGNTLSLGRLILASPDIPVLSIISSRANGLASSLRRFEEAYLFSNEGDLALRLASTAANYISFPSARQNHGHRLGSVALTNALAGKGIINLTSLRQNYPINRALGDVIAADNIDILKCLYITHSSGKGDGYLSLRELFALEHSQTQRASLADLFTFFDCTDYKDFKRRTRSKDEVGLLTRAKRRKNLNLWDYGEIIVDCLRGQLDVHGGYFHGEYSRELIYRLAFLGFEGMLQAVAEDTRTDSPENYQPENGLDIFNQQCMEKGIQAYLSPLRYRVNVQGCDIYTAKNEMMRTIQPEPLAEKVQEQIISESGQQSVSLAG